VITLTVLVLFAAALPYRYAQLQNVTPQANTRVGELLPEEVIWLAEMGISPRFHAGYFTALEVLSALPFFLVAGIIFLRKSDDALGLIASGSGILNGALITPFMNALLVVQPALEIPLLFLRSLGLLGLITLYFIFPDGHFVPRWSRLGVVFWAAYLSISLAVPRLRPPTGIASFQEADIPVLSFNIALMAFSALAQVYRYRYVATPIQRQQTKWTVFGLSAAMIVLIGGVVLPAILFPALRQPGILGLQMRFIAVTVTLLFTIPIFPVTMAIAILRYRLWDIDLIVRRTLVYSLLTSLLALIYFSGVTLLQSAFSATSGQSSTSAIVLSTLAIAALFNPLRRRIQDFIDRRFYRRRYDAEQALAGFAETARSETDLAQLSARLVGTVQETLQPKTISLWIPAGVTKKRDTGAM
jgi:hypothetical protein